VDTFFVGEDEMGGHVERMAVMRNTFKVFVRKREWKRPLGRTRRVWEDESWILRKEGGKVWSGCIWLTTGTSGRLL
jgi:hypothetical protein